MGGKYGDGRRRNRQEIERATADMAFAVEEIVGTCDIYTAGSYRRGKEEMGDVELIVDYGSEVARRRILNAWGQDPVQKNGRSRYEFTFVADGLQFDVGLAAKKFFGAMLLAKTGSAGFNLLLRCRARQLGYLLNQYGLFEEAGDRKPDYIVASGKGKGSRWTQIAGETEEEIFAALGLKYMPPQEREVESAEAGWALLQKWEA